MPCARSSLVGEKNQFRANSGVILPKTFSRLYGFTFECLSSPRRVGAPCVRAMGYPKALFSEAALQLPCQLSRVRRGQGPALGRVESTRHDVATSALVCRRRLPLFTRME